MTDKEIRPFHYEITVADSGDFYKRYDEFVRLLTVQMRDDGYVPLFDINPYVSTVHRGKEQKFKLTVQGVFVGGKSWRVHGITNGKEIPMSTLHSKSRP